ncbi:low affinity iron permease family protein [Kitasatospora sp. NPDC004745]|uniref:low affinity iron permease family protein n=1 Tax=unclassified Kitasatospora TaxID=2633591 RepID=UPI0033C86C28
MTFSHPAERGRGRFARLAERASNLTGSPLFYALCVLLVAAFVGVHVAGVSPSWQYFVGDMMSAVTLLLLALLKNAERRAERAIQRKLDAIAAALLAQQEDDPGEAMQDLRDAIRMEEEV